MIKPSSHIENEIWKLGQPANNVSVHINLDYEGLWYCEISINGKPAGKCYNCSSMVEAFVGALKELKSV